MSAEALAAYIRRHSIPAFTFAGAVFAIPTDIRNGHIERPIEQVPTNLRAIQEWLGY